MQLRDKMKRFRSSSPALISQLSVFHCSTPHTMKIRQSDYLLVDLDNINNKITTREVLPQTDNKYKKILREFDT